MRVGSDAGVEEDVDVIADGIRAGFNELVAIAVSAAAPLPDGPTTPAAAKRAGTAKQAGAAMPCTV